MWKLDWALSWYKNVVPQLWNSVALQLNQKVHCRSCAAFQKLKKFNCAFCAEVLVVETDRCALLRYAFDIMSFVPTSANQLMLA